MKKYTYEFKKKLCKMVCINHNSTCKTAKEYGVPLKTLEKWITAYNKNNHVFDDNYKTQAQLIDDLKKQVSSLQRDNEILKKTISLLAKKD